MPKFSQELLLRYHSSFCCTLGHKRSDIDFMLHFRVWTLDPTAFPAPDMAAFIDW
jgi:hypothetical protein